MSGDPPLFLYTVTKNRGDHVLESLVEKKWNPTYPDEWSPGFYRKRTQIGWLSIK